MNDNDWNKFLTDPDVLFLTKQYGERNIINILGPKEHQLSRLLSWLLDPRGGHGLDDYFIKSLLLTSWNKAAERDDNLLPKIFNKGGLTPEKIHAWNFESVIVEREFQLGDGPIDIFLVDPDNEIQIFVENKTGSKEGKNQTSTYRTNAKKLETISTGEWWHQLFIFIDWNNEEANDSEWVSIGYEWISESISYCLNNNTPNQEISFALKSIREYIDEDNYFNELHYRVMHRHRDTILDLSNNSNKLETNELKGLLLSDKNEPNNNQRNFYLKHWRLINSLAECGRWDHLKERFSQKHGGNFEFDPIYKRKNMDLWVRRKEWNKYDSLDPKADDWSIYVGLREKEENISIRFYVDADYLDNEFKEKAGILANAFLKEGDNKLKNGNSWYYFEMLTIKTEDDLLAKLFGYIKRVDAAIDKVFK